MAAAVWLMDEQRLVASPPALGDQITATARLFRKIKKLKQNIELYKKVPMLQRMAEKCQTYNIPKVPNLFSRSLK